MEDLPKTFGSANIAKYKKTVTTTKTTGNIDMRNLPQGFGSYIQEDSLGFTKSYYQIPILFLY